MKAALVAVLAATCLICAVSAASTKSCETPKNLAEKKNYDDECQYWRPGTFCHYQTKTCMRKYSGCSWSNAALGCELAGVLVSPAWCGSDDESCQRVFKNLNNVEHKACFVAKNQVCSHEKCPENMYHPECMKLRGD